MNNDNTTDSVLTRLRSLVPQRRLAFSESLQIAELQANRLLELFDVTNGRTPSELVTDLPRLAIRFERGLPVSGSAHWESGRWIITLNADEPRVRQRFSLMHEFKHVLDHNLTRYLYGDAHSNPVAAQLAERAADQFAACLLMPKRSLKSQWVATQDLTMLAARLGVSTRALSVRLWHLGLSPATPRCPRVSTRRPSQRRYFRFTPQLEAVT